MHEWGKMTRNHHKNSKNLQTKQAKAWMPAFIPQLETWVPPARHWRRRRLGCLLLPQRRGTYSENDIIHSFIHSFINKVFLIKSTADSHETNSFNEAAARELLRRGARRRGEGVEGHSLEVAAWTSSRGPSEARESRRQGSLTLLAMQAEDLSEAMK